MVLRAAYSRDGRSVNWIAIVEQRLDVGQRSKREGQKRRAKAKAGCVQANIAAWERRRSCTHSRVNCGQFFHRIILSGRQLLRLYFLTCLLLCLSFVVLRDLRKVWLQSTRAIGIDYSTAMQAQIPGPFSCSQSPLLPSKTACGGPIPMCSMQYL